MADLVVFFATDWGSAHGGVNAFNLDLATALAEFLAPSGQTVVCLTDSPPRGRPLRAHPLIVLHFDYPPGLDQSDVASRAVDLLNTEVPQRRVAWWFGHDVITGGLAVRARLAADEGNVGIFHHMNYWAYTALKHSDGDLALRRKRQQADLLNQADLVFAIGPKLFKSAHGLLPSDDRPPIIQVVPGLARTPVFKEPPPDFRATAFGRLTEEDDPIKQGRLAVRAVATLIRKHPDHVGPDPSVSLIGVEAESRDAIQAELLELGRGISGRMINIQALSYLTSREILYHEVAGSTVCLMLSFHEGFGLVGWESISAGVPLVLSKNSGTFELLASQLSARDLPRMVGAVDITATDADAEAVAEVLYPIAIEPLSAKRRAFDLREKLEQFTWESAAQNVAKSCDLAKGQEKVILSGATEARQAFEVEMYWGYRPSAHEDLRTAILSSKRTLVICGLGLNTIAQVLNDPSVVAGLARLIASEESFRPLVTVLSNVEHARVHERGGRLLQQKVTHGVAALQTFMTMLEELVPIEIPRPLVDFRTYPPRVIPRHFLLKADETLFVGSYLSHRQGSFSYLIKLINQGDGLYALFDKEIEYVVETTIPFNIFAETATEANGRVR